MPFFKSTSIKCQLCHHIFWAVRVTAVSSGTSTWGLFFFSLTVFYLIGQGSLFSAVNDLFHLQVTVVSWKETIQIPSSCWWDFLTHEPVGRFHPFDMALWRTKSGSQINVWPFCHMPWWNSWDTYRGTGFPIGMRLSWFRSFPSNTCITYHLSISPTFLDVHISQESDREAELDPCCPKCGRHTTLGDTQTWQWTKSEPSKERIPPT